MSFWPDSGPANHWWWSTSDLRRSIKLRTSPARSRFRLRSWSRDCGSYHASGRSWPIAVVPIAHLRPRRCGPSGRTVTRPDTSPTDCRNGRTPGMVSSRTESAVRPFACTHWEMTVADILELVDLDELPHQVGEK